MENKSNKKQKKGKSDLNVLAHKIVKEATKEKSEKKDKDKPIKK
jgi:hypothetical protein